MGLDEGAYLDILPTSEGFNQIALFNTAASTTPRWLTLGESEVTELLSVDVQRRIVLVIFFHPVNVATQGNSFIFHPSYCLIAGEDGIGRQLLSVPIPATAADQELVGPTALTLDDTAPPSHYSAAFSPQAGFYLLSYEGPGIPWQKLININDPSASCIPKLPLIIFKGRSA